MESRIKAAQATTVLAVALVALLTAITWVALPDAAEGAVLCEANQELCENTKIHSPELTAESTSPVFDFGMLGTIECESMKIVASGNEFETKVSQVAIGKCGEGCSVSASALPYDMELTPTTGGDGTVTLGTGGAGIPSFQVKCGENKCVYRFEGLEADFEGGAPAAVQINDSLTPETESFFCGPSTLEAAFEVVRPAPSAYVSSPGPFNAGEGRICRELESTCKSENAFGIEMSLEPRPGKTILDLGELGTQTCSGQIFAGYAAKVSDFLLVGCSGEIGSCEVQTDQFLPYDLNLRASGQGDGRLSFGREGKRPFAIKVNCSGGVSCEFSASEAAEGLVVGSGAPEGAAVYFDDLPLELDSGSGGCPETAYFSSEYWLWGEGPLFVAHAQAPGQTVLCETSAIPCEEGETLGELSGVLKEGTAAVFQQEIAPAWGPTCQGGELSIGELASGEGELAASGTVETFDFSECAAKTLSCSLTSSGGFDLSTEALGPGNGAVWTENGGVAVVVNCIFIKCEYLAPIAEGDLTGGAPALLDVHLKFPAKAFPGTCGEYLRADLEYETTQSPLFVSRL